MVSWWSMTFCTAVSIAFAAAVAAAAAAGDDDDDADKFAMSLAAWNALLCNQASVVRSPDT
jgi:hypothetical protein